jgi:hypothetical protein
MSILYYHEVRFCLLPAARGPLYRMVEPTEEEACAVADYFSGSPHPSTITPPQDAVPSSTIRLRLSERAACCYKSGISVFLFSCAMEIENLNEDSSMLRRPKESDTSCAIAMLYNLALSLRHEGIEEASQNQLFKARKMYREVRQVFFSRDADCSSTHYSYLKTVILNNLGHISHESAGVLSASECLQLNTGEIGKLLLTGEFEQHFPSNDDKTGFVMNTLFRVHTAGAA